MSALHSKGKLLHEKQLQIWFAEILMYLWTVSDLNHISHNSITVVFSAVKPSRYTSRVMWLHDDRPTFRKPSLSSSSGNWFIFIAFIRCESFRLWICKFVFFFLWTCFMRDGILSLQLFFVVNWSVLYFQPTVFFRFVIFLFCVCVWMLHVCTSVDFVIGCWVWTWTNKSLITVLLLLLLLLGVVVVVVVFWGDLGLDGWIILGWTCKRWDVSTWTELVWSRIETDGRRLWVR